MGLDSLVNDKTEKKQSSSKSKSLKKPERDEFEGIDVTELSFFKLDFNRQKHVDELTRRINEYLFLREYDEQTGSFRGPDPPSIFETNRLPEEGDDRWHEEWIDLTDEWEYAGSHPAVKSIEYVKTECLCDKTVKMSKKARYMRCQNCFRVLINRMWKDNRVSNPNQKSRGSLTEFAD